MNTFSGNYSKSARRKWRRYGVVPQSPKVESRKKIKLNDADIATIASGFKPELQQHLWAKVELYGKPKKRGFKNGECLKVIL